MAYTRGVFGIEYQQNRQPEHPSWLPIVLEAVLFILLVSLTVTLYRRMRLAVSEAAEETAVVQALEEQQAAEKKAAEPRVVEQKPVEKKPVAKPAPEIRVPKDSRPTIVRNLFLRLQEAERSGDIEKQVSVLEQLRALPGNLVADQDDKLAKRLGELNLKLLFEAKSPRWCAEVAVRRGENATRIARANGSTLESLKALNGDVSSLKVGKRLCVLNHPKFSLAVYRLSKTADLTLNGKFFKRYYLPSAPTGAVGSYATAARLRTTLAELGITPDVRDRDELATLLPAGTPVIISEFR